METVRWYIPFDVDSDIATSGVQQSKSSEGCEVFGWGLDAELMSVEMQGGLVSSPLESPGLDCGTAAAAASVPLFPELVARVRRLPTLAPVSVTQTMMGNASENWLR